MMDNQKVLAYAMAYLESKISEHEKFMSNYNGDITSLAQYSLVERYKEELNQLEYMMN